MDKQELSKEIVDSMFKDHQIVKVVFTKVSTGEERTMIGTTDLTLVPEEHHPKPLADGETARPVPDSTKRIYELDNHWRSFRYDSVISIEPN